MCVVCGVSTGSKAVSADLILARLVVKRVMGNRQLAQLTRLNKQSAFVDIELIAQAAKAELGCHGDQSGSSLVVWRDSGSSCLQSAH